MKQFSAEAVAASDPNVILLTDFGYDKLGSVEKIKELPGIAGTKAAQNNRICRVEEHDMVYLGPHKLRTLATQQDLVIAGVVHDLNLAGKYADHLVLLHQGKVLSSGPRE